MMKKMAEILKIEDSFTLYIQEFETQIKTSRIKCSGQISVLMKKFLKLFVTSEILIYN